MNLNKRIFYYLKTNYQSVRYYALGRKYPIDPSDSEKLTVYNYPLMKDGQNIVYVWGLAEHGALGYFLQRKNKNSKRFKNLTRPLRLTFAEVNNVRDITAGYGFTVFLVKLNDGYKLFGTGLNTDSQVGVHEPRRNHPLNILLHPAPIQIPLNKSTRVHNMSAGRAHLAINTSDGLYTLGNNAYGQCGRTIIENEKYEGSRVVHMIPNCEGETIEHVECGQDHTLFLTSSGRVYSCGWGADGQTGLGHYNNCAKPSQVVGDIQNEKIVKISSKADCVLAINDKGDVFGWGNSEYGQLLPKNVPHPQVNSAIYLKKCSSIGKVVDVAAAGSFCLALNEDGEVFSWGYGILGRGLLASHSWEPERIPSTLFGHNQFFNNAKVISIYCGISSSAAVNSYGDLYTWGKNQFGRLGLGHDKDQFFPLKVALSGFVKKISCGVDHSVVLCKPI